MNEPLILTDRKIPGVTLLTLNRVERCNALNNDLLRDLISAVKETHELSDQRVIILNGNGSVFSSGLDLKESIENANAAITAALVEQAFTILYQSPLVTIAVAHGKAIAGGAGLIAACDVAIASEETEFSFPEVRRGIVAAFVSILLSRQISERAIRELLLIGEPIDALRAKEIGLINQVVPKKELLEKAKLMAEQAKKGAPAAIVETKNLLEKLSTQSIRGAMSKAAVVHKQARMHIEAQEGIAAFLEKREPRWGYS